MHENKKLCKMLGQCEGSILDEPKTKMAFTKAELIAHIEEDDKNFQKVIDIMREAIDDDTKLKQKLESVGA